MKEGVIVANKNLNEARKNKNDEFYTQLSDIENELKHYIKYFRGKVVYCNCDDPVQSNFWRYFHLNFTYFGLKKLIATHYRVEGGAYTMEYTGENDLNIYEGKVKNLKGTGDFRDEECIEILMQADIVCTNPPFSLFREYLKQLIEYDKKFVIIGPTNALTYKEVFPLLRDNKVWLGNGFLAGNAYFSIPIDCVNNYNDKVYNSKTGFVKFRNCKWYTNLDIVKRHEPLELLEHYTPEKYPKYDNYNAINVDRVHDIPCDYDGVMGVPITFMDKYCPEQFELMNCNDCRVNDSVPIRENIVIKDKYGSINGKCPYQRILIRKIKSNITC